MTHPSWGTEWQAATLPKEAPDEIEAQRTMRRLKRRRRLILRGSLLTVGRPLAVVIAGMAWVGVDGLHARGELKIAATQVHVQEGQVVKGDRKAAAATLKSLQTYAASAREDTHGPHWSAARASTCCWRRTSGTTRDGRYPRPGPPAVCGRRPGDGRRAARGRLLG